MPADDLSVAHADMILQFSFGYEGALFSGMVHCSCIIEYVFLRAFLFESRGIALFADTVMNGVQH